MFDFDFCLVPVTVIILCTYFWFPLSLLHCEYKQPLSLCHNLCQSPFCALCFAWLPMMAFWISVCFHFGLLFFWELDCQLNKGPFLSFGVCLGPAFWSCFQILWQLHDYNAAYRLMHQYYGCNYVRGHFSASKILLPWYFKCILLIISPSSHSIHTALLLL